MAPEMAISEHEALARRFRHAWNDNDWEAIEACFLPDVEVLAPEGWPEAETSRGWPSVRRQFERLNESWRDEQIEWIDFAEYWFVAKIRQGRIDRGAFFLDGEESARAARGGAPA
jgi:hypothetical protein